MIEKVRKTRKKGELTAKIYQVWGKILTILVSRTSLNTQKRAKNEISVKLTGGYIVGRCKMTLNEILKSGQNTRWTKCPVDKMYVDIMSGGQNVRGQNVRTPDYDNSVDPDCY